MPNNNLASQRRESSLILRGQKHQAPRAAGGKDGQCIGVNTFLAAVHVTRSASKSLVERAALTRTSSVASLCRAGVIRKETMQSEMGLQASD